MIQLIWTCKKKITQIFLNIFRYNSRLNNFNWFICFCSANAFTRIISKCCAWISHCEWWIDWRSILKNYWNESEETRERTQIALYKAFRQHYQHQRWQLCTRCVHFYSTLTSALVSEFNILLDRTALINILTSLAFLLNIFL